MTNNEMKNLSTHSAEESVALIRVDRIYESLRYNDYSPENGLGEIVDNSVEAKAEHIYVTTNTEKVRKPGKKRASDEITEIAVVDDGCGMDRNTLHKCLALGESLRQYGKSEKKGIGRFGVGMTLGSISLSRRVEVYSRTDAKEKFLYTYIDLDDIKDGTLLQIPEPMHEDPPEQYRVLLAESSGTIVILKKCDQISGIADFANYLGRTYRKFIERGLQIQLNGEHVYLHDPLYMASPTIFDQQKLEKEDSIEPKATSLQECIIKREIPGSGGKTADIVIRMSLLPEEWRPTQGSGGSPEAKKRKIDKNEGISILRADREVFYGHVPYITGVRGEARSDEKDRWWGCEISFPPELDHDFQVRYIKRGAEPKADLRDKIRSEIGSTVKSARSLVQAYWNKNNSEKSKQDGAFGKAEDTMENADNLLPKSKKKTASASSKQKKDEHSSFSEPEHDTTQEKEPVHNKKRKKPYSIELVNYPRTVLFDTVHMLDRIVIKLNVNHPFYTDVLHPLCGDLSTPEVNQEHEDIKNAILLLLFSYAKAESAFDSHEEIFDSLRAQWGTALAIALGEYERS